MPKSATTDSKDDCAVFPRIFNNMVMIGHLIEETGHSEWKERAWNASGLDQLILIP